MSEEEKSVEADSIPEECSTDQEARSPREIKLEHRDD